MRLRDWQEVYEPFPPRQLQHAGRRAAWTAASRSATTAARSATSSPTGTTSSTATTGATRSSACTPPTTSPSSPAGCARRRARPRACSASTSDPVTIKQVEVEIIDRAWDEGWVAPRRRRVKTGKRVAVVGSGPAGLAAAQQLTRAGHDVVVFERADRIGGLLRYGIPEFKMEKRHLDRRLAQMEAEGTEFRTERQRRRRRRRSTSCARRSTRSCSPAAPPRGATCRSPGASSRGIYQAMEYLPLAQPGAAGRPRRAADHRRGQARRDHRRRRHRRRLPRHRDPPGRGPRSPSSRSCPGRPSERPAANPWPTYPMIYRVSSAHEEGGERVYAVNTECFLGDDDGNVRALRPRGRADGASTAG